MRIFGKRILSVLIALSMLGTMMVYAAGEPTSVWDYTFDGLSAMPSAWSVGSEDGLVPDPVYAGQAALVTTATNTLASKVAAGGLIVSYDLYIPALPGSAEAVVKVKGTDGDVLTLWADADAIIAYGTDATTSRVSTYPLKEWFTLTAVLDIDAKTSAVYVNGVQMSDAAQFESDATDVTTITNSFTSGMLVDEVYVAAFASGADAKTAADARFVKCYRYVETLDRGSTTKIPPNGEKKFDGELVREEPYADTYVEYKPYYICEVTEYQVKSASGTTSYKKEPDILETDTLTGVKKTTELTLRHDALASTQTAYGTENVLVDTRSGLVYSKGRAVKNLETPISTGVVMVGADIHIPLNYSSALTVPLIDLENSGTSVLEMNVTGTGDGETGVRKLTVTLANGDVVFAGNYTEDRWTNIGIILDLDRNTAELLANGISGGVFETPEITFNTVKLAGTSTLRVDSLRIEAYPNVEHARTASAVKNVKDDVLFSKVGNFLKTERRFSADTQDLIDARNAAEQLMPGTLTQRDIYGEINETWGENFNSFADGEKLTGSYTANEEVYVYDGHAKIKRNSTDKSRLLKTIAQTSGSYTTEFDFMIEKKADTEMIAMITSNASKKICYLATRSGKIQLFDGNGTQTLSNNYQEGRWYTIALTVDIDNKTLAASIDGAQKFENHKWYDSSATDARRAFDTYRYEATSYPTCEYFIDNLIVYQDIAQPIAVTSPLFRDADGETTYGATSGGTLKSVYVRNENNITGDLFAGVYVSDVLKNVKRIANVKEGRQTLDLALPETEEDIELKFFAWNNLKPITEATPYRKDTTNLFILSDSIYDGASGLEGIGDKLDECFDPDYVTVTNKAIAGNTMQSIAEVGNLNYVLNAIKPGDYVLVSFAHNDSKYNGAGFVMVERDMQAPYAPGTYQDRLTRYANTIRARGGNPIFATSLARYRTGAKIGVDHGSYIDAMRELAKELDIPLVDLNKYSVQLLNEDNKTAETRYIMTTLGAATADTTHLTNDGAIFFAKWIAGQIKQLGLPIGEHTVGLE